MHSKQNCATERERERKTKEDTVVVNVRKKMIQC